MGLAEPLQIEMNLPAWVPRAACNYLAHTETGLSIRALARAEACHASTILRQVRRYEMRRDDPLVDDALTRLSHHVQSLSYHIKPHHIQESPTAMTAYSPLKPTDQDFSKDFDTNALRIMRRMAESGAVLAVAKDMNMAVVVRENADKSTLRTAVADRETAQGLALRDWIATRDTEARVVKYYLTATGRSALKDMLFAAGETLDSPGFAEKQTAFAGAGAYSNKNAPRSGRGFINDSPLHVLARRRDKDGTAFLPKDLVAAGERLREDFELAGMGPNVTQNWDRFLSGPIRTTGETNDRPFGSAKDRLSAALNDLGPGLGDVALRCCCFLEGLETAEKKLGWAARSGKIVLRIALQRLKRHYDAQGKFAPKIG